MNSSDQYDREAECFFCHKKDTLRNLKWVLLYPAEMHFCSEKCRDEQAKKLTKPIAVPWVSELKGSK